MNRIIKILYRNGKRINGRGNAAILPIGNSPTMKPKCAPKSCSFCGLILAGSKYTAYSLPTQVTLSAICINCIRTYSVPARFCDVFAIMGQAAPDYRPVETRLWRRVALEDGSESLKRAVIEIVIRFVKRQSAIFAGCVFEICPKTGVSLTKLPRVAVVTKELSELAKLFRIACSQVGLIYRESIPNDLASGTAYKKLFYGQTNGQGSWAEHGIILCLGYVPPIANSIVVYGCKSADGIPKNVERIFV